MVNMFDMNGTFATADARREQFLKEVEDDRIARMLKPQRQRTPGRVRRAVGLQLIRVGSQLSGERSVLARRSEAVT